MAKLLDEPSRSLKELRLLPGFTPADGGMANTSLTTTLCGNSETSIALSAPFVSAAMQAVTGCEMAVAISQLGGIGVVPVSQSIEAQCETVAAVKRFKAGFQTDLLTLSPAQSLREVLRTIEQTGYTRFPVTDNGIFHGRLLGVLTDNDFDPRRDLDFRVADRMRKDVECGIELDDLDDANRLMVETGRGFLPIVSEEGTLLSVVFQKDRDKHLRHPGETVDAERRLRVAAAVSTHPEDRGRARALLEHGVDALSLDASDGHTAFQAEMLGFIKSIRDIPVIAGNVVTAEGFDFLAGSGADAVKVGMGVGSGCTTQAVKSTGRGQATALREVAAARDQHAERTGKRLPLIADGGISGPAEITVALALGADSVMLGNLLARYSESPGQIVRGLSGLPGLGGQDEQPASGEWKEYWMEGSKRAANTRRYAQSRELFFEEGIEGFVPHEGSIYDRLPQLALAVRSALSTAGCRNIRELQERAVLEPQSETSLRDAAVRGMQHTATRG
jgi:IMP dehydrogenase